MSYVAVVSDLASDERLSAEGRSDEPPPMQGTTRLTQFTTSWRGWYGGFAMLAICLAPEALLLLGRPDNLKFHAGAHSGVDVGGLLAALPGIAAFTLLARLVGYRRRDAVLMVLPVINVYLAWVAGARAVQLRPDDPPDRWAGSRKATSVAILLQCLVSAAYLTWVIVVEVMAWP